MKKTIFLFLCMVLGIAFVFSFAEARVVVRYGYSAPLYHPQHQAALAFAKYVAEKSGGDMEVQVFPLGQLGGERPMVEQTQAGTLQMTAVSAGVLANFVKEVGLIELPFLYSDREAAHRLLDDREIKAGFSKQCEPRGLVFLGYTEFGFRDITNSRKPVTRPDDLKGLKMRIMDGPMFVDTFRALGATPVALPFPEIFGALEQKVIDGQDYPLFTAVMMRFTEVNRFATVTNHILTECPVVMNKKFWESLTPGQQNILREAAEVQVREARERSEKARADAIDKARSQRVEITVLSFQDRAEFRRAVKPVYDRYREVAGPEWFDFFMKKVEAYSGPR